MDVITGLKELNRAFKARNIILLSIARGITMEGLRDALEVMAFEDGSIEARIKERRLLFYLQMI